MKSPRSLSLRATIFAAVAATVGLAAVSTASLALIASTMPPGSQSLACSAPKLRGTVLRVAASDMGGGMMGRDPRMMPRGSMQLAISTTSVPHGTVSIVVENLGNLPHEVIVLPLSGQIGTRPVGLNRQVDETSAVGEASRTCGSGPAAGIAPGSTGWVTLNLPVGRYELLCNRPGHYAAGMYAEISVT